MYITDTDMYVHALYVYAHVHIGNNVSNLLCSFNRE